MTISRKPMSEETVGQRAAEAGFTLVEIMLVVMIIAILAGIVVPKLSKRVGMSQVAATRATIQNVGTALDLYEVDNGHYPDSLQSLLTLGEEINWNGPYLKDGRMPRDPWGKDLKYDKKEDGYELRSSGPDVQMGTADDITN